MELNEPSAKYLVQAGYKQSEVGLIPTDWAVRPLLSTVSIARGQVDPKTQPYRSMVLVAPDHIQSGTGRLLQKRSAEDQGAISGKYLFSPGDIVYSKIRPYLKKAILADFDGLCSADMYPLRAAHDVCAGFIFASLLGARFTQYAESVSVRSGMPKINRAELADFSLALPASTPEQERVANALTDADALIESLEQLLAKKRQIKQGAMQELLTGQRRLSGFSKSWARAQLSDICQMKSGESITSERIDEHSQYPCYGGNGIRGFTDRFTHSGPHVLVGRQGALCGNVAFVDGKFFASEHAVVVTSLVGSDICWLGYVLTSLELNQYSESSAQPGLAVSRLLTLEVLAPDALEQAAIATILSDMDTEITALEARLTKARQLKQGMAQALLTGRIRLV